MPEKFQSRVEKQVSRRLKKRREGPWSELATFGMVGWSVALPTVLGVGLGSWLDRRYPSDYSYTLMLLALGVLVGCANAWRWLESSAELGNEADDER